MSYRIRIESFEGPFDLLLYLVSQQKVDIGAISITEIVDQFLAEVSRMRNLDLDVASDFLLVASTQLEIKAASLIPVPKSDVAGEFEEITASEARDILVARLVEYKKYKTAATALQTRFENEGRMHGRPFGPDRALLTLMPDYLEGLTLEALALLCINSYTKREEFLLEAEHIAAKPIPIEIHVRAIHQRIVNAKRLRFSDLVSAHTPYPVLVATFLAILELYKRSMVKLVQKRAFADIDIHYIEGSGELSFEGDDAITSVAETEAGEAVPGAGAAGVAGAEAVPVPDAEAAAEVPRTAAGGGAAASAEVEAGTAEPAGAQQAK
ncbi:MAG: segregation/condensation protein A [Coriobacteriaceae bacterium]|jgi:segregation and condensation protein A|nr:segregation/condensation protein A [Coriobacteriaceae bacterium]